MAAHSIDGLSLLVEKFTLSTSLTLQRHEVSLQSSLNCLCVKPELRTGRKSDPDWAFLQSAPCAPLCVRARLYMLYIFSLFFENVNFWIFLDPAPSDCAHLCVRTWLNKWIVCLFYLFFDNVNYGAFHNSAPYDPLCLNLCYT